MEDSNRPDKQTDDVASLVRLADRSTLSRERMERVRVVAKRHWREQTDRRSRTRVWQSLVATAAVLAGVAVVFGFLSRSTEDGGPKLARIESLSGAVTLRGVSGSVAATSASGVATSTTVDTGDDGRVALRLPSGHSLRVDRDSEINLRDDGDVELVAGALYLESDPQRPGQAVGVLTPFGRVHEIGTQFEVRIRTRGMRVRLREGLARVERPGKNYTVEAGTELNVDDAGQVTTHPIEPYGEDWAWVSDVATVPDMRGRSAYFFLTWIAREKGWSIRFESEAALRTAQDAMVEGRFERLTPDQALAAILPASRLAHDVADGTLTVRPLPRSSS